MPLVTANQFQLTPDIVGSLSSGFQLGGQIQQQQATQQQLGQQQALQSKIQGLRQQALGGNRQALTQLAAIDPQQAQQLQKFQIGQTEATQESQQRRIKSVVEGALQVQNLPDDASKLNFLKRRREDLKFRDVPTQDTDELIQLFEAGQGEQANALISGAVQTGQQLGLIKAPTQDRKTEFEELTKDLPAEQKKEATLIKLGLSPRAVGSAIQTISDRGIEEQIGKSSATIKQREKFGELTGASRAKTIDQGVEKIAKINLGLGNIDRAISALNRGAGVGAIQRFLPSFKAASVELDNIQKSMALDVIGAVTFGALSEGELNLAKEVALPTGLDTPQLIQHLQDRKSAQEKLKNYYNEQIQFLDQGGTVAGFLRQKEQETPTPPAKTKQRQGLSEGVIIRNPQTGQRLKVVGGKLVEVQ